MGEEIIDENGIVGELILDIQSLIRRLHEWVAVLGILVDEVGRDCCLVRGFLNTILATCEKSRRPTSVYRRRLLQALDVIQSDNEVGFYDSTT